MNQYTLLEFNRVADGRIIKHGVVNHPVNINMRGNIQEFRYVVKKGFENSWCIYVHSSEKSLEYVKLSGRKIKNKEDIVKIFPCTDEVYKLYRF